MNGMSGDHHWVTFFRVCFPELIDGKVRKFATMPDADIWRFCPSQRVGANGLPTFVSDVWYGMAAFNEENLARTAFRAPVDSLPFLSEADNIWTALAVTFAHRGTVNWRGELETDCALQVCRKPSEGKLIVVTSAGFDAETAISVSRIKEFVQGVEAVMNHYANSSGNVYRDTSNGSAVDGRDGITFSM